MLVLTRKAGEEIVVDGHIRIRIVTVQGNRIRIGVEAPSEVKVTRAELEEPAVAKAKR